MIQLLLQGGTMAAARSLLRVTDIHGRQEGEETDRKDESCSLTLSFSLSPVSIGTSK